MDVTEDGRVQVQVIRKIYEPREHVAEAMAAMRKEGRALAEKVIAAARDTTPSPSEHTASPSPKRELESPVRISRVMRADPHSPTSHQSPSRPFAVHAAAPITLPDSPHTHDSSARSNSSRSVSSVDAADCEVSSAHEAEATIVADSSDGLDAPMPPVVVQLSPIPPPAPASTEGVPMSQARDQAPPPPPEAAPFIAECKEHCGTCNAPLVLKCEDCLSSELHADRLANATLNSRCMQLADQNKRMAQKLESCTEEAHETEAKLAEAKVCLQRQHDRICGLMANASDQQNDHFSTIEELAEVRAELKIQRERTEELFSKLNEEKRAKAAAEEWLLQLRDQCIRLKDVVHERNKLSEELLLLEQQSREERKNFVALQQNYSALWERHKGMEEEAVSYRRSWHRASVELGHAKDSVSSMQRYSDHLRAKLRESQQDNECSFNEALEALAQKGVEGMSDVQVSSLTANLSQITQQTAVRLLGRDCDGKLKKLMATLHPDRTAIPACKETLVKRFQLLNHLRSLLD